jgi:hypothetical protein
MSDLTPNDLAKHAALGIERDVLDRQHVHRVDDREAREKLALNGRTGRLDGVLYPYFLPGQPSPVTHRLRRDHPDIEQGRPRNKYLSGYGDRRHLYFVLPDHESTLADTGIPVVIVESEKGAMAVACAMRRQGRRVLAIALGGCYGWRGRIGKMTAAHTNAQVDEWGVLPDFDRIVWINRETVIAFDANAAINPHVQSARRGLTRELLRRQATARILTLPVEDGINGPDDYIGCHGAAAFGALLDSTIDALTVDYVLRLNQRHAVVREGGRTVVITEGRDPVLDRGVVTRESFSDFRNFYLRERVQVGVETEGKRKGQPIMKPLGHAWLTSPDRRQYDGIVMNPAGDVPGYLNLWRGFAVTPTLGSWQRLHDHLFQVICGSNSMLFDYVVAWLAAGVQHPERPAEVALALRGPRGTGKGLFARAYGDLFGQHYLQIANTKHLTGHFNAHLEDCVVLFADEAFWAGDKAGESVLKMLVTEPVIPIERKGRDVVLAKNRLRLILASNHDWIVPAGMDERRFCVLDVDSSKRGDHDYFAAIVQELDAGGRAAFVHDLQQFDLSGVNLRQVPHTEALRQQKVLSLAANERWLFDKLMSGRWLEEHDGFESWVVKDQLHEDYVARLAKVGIDRRSTETELGMFIKKMVPEAQSVRRTVNGRRQWVWQWPTLAALRVGFDAATQCRHPWPEAEEDD